MRRVISKSKMGFAQLLFGSFFRWWWAVITGIVTLLSFIFTPSGVHLSRVMFTTLTIVGLLLLFLLISTIYQSWLLYQKQSTTPIVVGCQRSNSYSGEFIFIIEGVNLGAQGTVAELKRFVNGVEVPIALVEFMECNSKGQFQARPVWISSGHLRDLRTGQFFCNDIIVEPLIHLRTLLSAKNLDRRGVK